MKCESCGQEIESHIERLREELSKVPLGLRYVYAPNFKEIQKLLKEGTPYIRRMEGSEIP